MGAPPLSGELGQDNMLPSQLSEGETLFFFSNGRAGTIEFMRDYGTLKACVGGEDGAILVWHYEDETQADQLFNLIRVAPEEEMYGEVWIGYPDGRKEPAT
jgi:hypothetical protein